MRALCRGCWVRNALSAFGSLSCKWSNGSVLPTLGCPSPDICLAMRSRRRKDKLQLRGCWQVTLVGQSHQQTNCVRKSMGHENEHVQGLVCEPCHLLSLLCGAEQGALLWAGIFPQSPNPALPCGVCCSEFSSPPAFSGCKQWRAQARDVREAGEKDPRSLLPTVLTVSYVPQPFRGHHSMQLPPWGLTP